jgi:hypothetical protein
MGDGSIEFWKTLRIANTPSESCNLLWMIVGLHGPNGSDLVLDIPTQIIGTIHHLCDLSLVVGTIEKVLIPWKPNSRDICAHQLSVMSSYHPWIRSRCYVTHFESSVTLFSPKQF